ncbi:MAG: hypothetical protein VX899_17005 [Myxococcota bacterium]|nr:hypothetical protein [Myxococcota bacterium]
MVRAKLRTLKAKELWVMRGMALLFASMGIYAFLSAAGITLARELQPPAALRRPEL